VRILSLFLLAAATAACGRGDDAPADRIAAAPVAGSCGGEGDAALALTARAVVAGPDSALPAGLVLLPDGSLVTVERGSPACPWAGAKVPRPGGSSCTILYHDGRSWCGHSGDCHTQITMTPLEVSPVGTYLAAGGPQVEEDRVRRQECNGFVTGHAAGDGARAAGEVALRI
jgi:hypothetical protein